MTYKAPAAWPTKQTDPHWTSRNDANTTWHRAQKIPTDVTHSGLTMHLQQSKPRLDTNFFKFTFHHQIKTKRSIITMSSILLCKPITHLNAMNLYFEHFLHYQLESARDITYKSVSRHRSSRRGSSNSASFNTLNSTRRDGFSL